MTKIDARILSIDKLFALRKKVIEQHEGGSPVMQIAETFGLSWDAVNAAIKLYKEAGIEGLKPKPRGRKKGTGRILTPDQEVSIRHTLYTIKPYQVGLEYPDSYFKVRLWSLERVRQYIQIECGITLSTACLSIYLERWGLRLKQKSLDPTDRCTPEIQHWLKENFEEKKDYNLTHVYWVVRKTINATIPDNRYGGLRNIRLSIVTAINAKKNEDDYWCVYKGNFTKEKQIGFMKFLMLQSERKVLIIRTSEDHFTHLKIERFKRKNTNKIVIIPPLLPGEHEKLIQQQESIDCARAERAEASKNRQRTTP